MKRILFVDDEPLVLEGMRRMLRGMRAEWEMEFAESGAAALKSMAERPADVVVSDMRMPGMSGAELLNQIMQRYPKTVRFILSGYADEKMVIECVGGTHQFLSKPCSNEILSSTIQRALDMDRWMNSTQIKVLVSSMATIPSLPALYFELLHELRSANSDLDRVGEMISSDPAMTAKILQMVNSAFFGLSRQFSDPCEAVIQLGMETIKSLVMTVHVFSEFAGGSGATKQLEQILNHSLASALRAKRIAQLENQDKKILDESFTAGLLHDIGRVALMANLPERYEEAIRRSQSEGISLVESEKLTFGASHSEVGAYLLGLWGLPISLVETALFHHAPGTSPNKTFCALTAVHVANVLEPCSISANPRCQKTQMDKAYLVETGVWGRIPVWRQDREDCQQN